MKTYQKCSLALLFIIGAAVSSCKKHTISPPQKKQPATAFYQDSLIRNGGGPTGIGAPYAAEYFPNTPGDEWTYEVTDSLHGNQQYRLTLKILGGSNGQTAWLFIYPDGNDTVHVSTEGEIIDFLPVNKITPHDNPPFISLGARLITPFYRGMQWRYNRYGTNATVTGLDTLTQNSFGFPAPVKIFTLNLFLGGGVEYGGVYTMLFAPDIGIISLDRRILNTMPTVHERWQLISYHLQAPPLYNAGK